MVEAIVGSFWLVVGIYAMLGLIFAVIFSAHWAAVLDPSAKTGSWGFRLVIIPGALALWPLLALKILRGESKPPNPERPLRPSQQRLLGGRFWLLVLVVVVPVGGMSLWLKKPRTVSQVAGTGSGAPLRTTSSVDAKALPLSVGVAGDQTLEITVDEPLTEPVVALYWQPAADAPANQHVFLGSIWGPANLAFRRPAPGGVLTFMALGGEQRVLETVSIP